MRNRPTLARRAAPRAGRAGLPAGGLENHPPTGSAPVRSTHSGRAPQPLGERRNAPRPPTRTVFPCYQHGAPSETNPSREPLAAAPARLVHSRAARQEKLSSRRTGSQACAVSPHGQTTSVAPSELSCPQPQFRARSMASRVASAERGPLAHLTLRRAVP